MSTPKRVVIADLLARGPVRFVCDGRVCDVPDQYKTQGLILRFGHNLIPSIYDLDCGDECLSGTLTFGGVPYHVLVPWAAISHAVCEVEDFVVMWQSAGAVLAVAEREPVDEVTGPLPGAPSPGPGRPNLKLVP